MMGDGPGVGLRQIFHLFWNFRFFKISIIHQILCSLSLFFCDFRSVEIIQVMMILESVYGLDLIQ